MTPAENLRTLAEMTRGPVLACLIRSAANATEGGREWMMRYERLRIEGAMIMPHSDDKAAIALALEILGSEIGKQE